VCAGGFILRGNAMKRVQLVRCGLLATMLSSLAVAGALAGTPSSSANPAPAAGNVSFGEYSFEDNLGSCRESVLPTLDGAVDAHVKGVGCRRNSHRVRWFAHPDGSPDGLGWVH
jgi:hypothetical protein